MRYVRRVRRAGSKADKARYVMYKEPARVLVFGLLTEMAALYNVSYAGVAIRNQRTRWGSCSKKGNLNFNYKIVFLPPHLAKYIVAHELCHLIEFNHSVNFWELVGQTIPNFKNCRNELRKFHIDNL